MGMLHNEEKIGIVEAKLDGKKRPYTSYGTWHVTTEGDCEGKSVKDLGVHTGFIDEIAFALGSQAYYSLTFELAKELPDPVKVKPVGTVNVVLNIDSGTWDMSPKE